MDKKEFRQMILEGPVILDGATGTELAKKGIPQGACPEEWILDNPDIMIDIQSAYVAAGSRILYAPTFGGNRFKLAEFGLEKRLREINRDLVRISRKGAGEGCLVFGDLAPTGHFIEPFGDVPFEDAVNAYKEQIAALIEGGIDGIVIETMMEIQEARAALIAARETCGLPVMVSMTYEKGGRTLSGTDAVSALITLQSLGADAVGCNCSTGPADMLEVIRAMKPYATVPLLAKPNAGMPRLVKGETIFDMGPDEFASFVEEFFKEGVNIFGGCCGTGPEHIARAALKARGLSVRPPERKAIGALSSARGTVFTGQDQPFMIIGERINPTGKKALKAELLEGKMSLVQRYALEQKQNGAHLLDVNMGMPGIDEKDMMLAAVRVLARSSDLPLCIDTTQPDIVEAALRLYPGRVLVNSISGEEKRLAENLPAARRYGAMFILLPLDDTGIPKTVEGRKDVVEHVLKEADSAGFYKEDILVDGLVMTVSSDQEAANITLGLVEWCARDMGIATVSGVSNVSFGMPERQWINSAFLAMGVGRGLTSAIVNPSLDITRGIIAATDALSGRDQKLLRYLDLYSGVSAADKNEVKSETPTEQVYTAVLRGDDGGVVPAIERALETEITAKELVDNWLIPAIQEAGNKFDKKEYFLPQLVMSADAMKKGFGRLEPLLLVENPDAGKGPVVVLATVKGDIHDIGKNIVMLMLKNYGFEVVDLGKDVPAETILEGAASADARVIGLSALMTTTMTEMKEVIDLANEKGISGAKIIVGGAVVDQNYADEIGADGYAGNAMEAVRLAQRLTE